MELMSIRPSQLLQEIGLFSGASEIFDLESSSFKKFLITTIRNIYSCSDGGLLERTTKIRVLNHIRSFAVMEGQEEELKHLISEVHELMEDIGEIVPVQGAGVLRRYRSQISTFVFLPLSARDRISKVLLLGPCWPLDSASVPSEILYENENGLRYLKGNRNTLENFLYSIGIYPIPFEQWRGYPSTLKPTELLNLVMERFLDSRDSSTSEALRIVEKGHQKYFLRRIRPPKKSDNGIYAMRKFTDFGADVSLVGLIQDGQCRKSISLPIVEIAQNERDCERLIIAALDFDSDMPGQVTVSGPSTYGNFFNFAFVSFYLPPVSWVKKLLLGYGHVLSKPRDGALVTFAIPWEIKDDILGQVAQDMFLKIE